MVKVCTKCNARKPLDEYHRNNQRKDGRESICAVCRSTRVRAYNADKAAARRIVHDRNRIKTSYGISLEQVQTMHDSQNGVCAICSKPEPGKLGKLHIDHCHATGVVRGLLCHKCNLMLGHANDDTETLSKAISYLTGGAP